LVSGVSSAGATGDIGAVMTVAAKDGSVFAKDPGTASIVVGMGASAGKITNAGINGDISGGLSAAGEGLHYIPGTVGEVGSSLLKSSAAINTAVSNGDT
jgi:hypothetical protein